MTHRQQRYRQKLINEFHLRKSLQEQLDRDVENLYNGDYKQVYDNSIYLALRLNIYRKVGINHEKTVSNINNCYSGTFTGD